MAQLAEAEPGSLGDLRPHEFFRCLSDPLRLHAMLLIEQCGELCVCELVAALAEPQPKVSRHLAQLRACGLLQDNRRGHWVFYALHPQLPVWARQLLSTLGQLEPLAEGKCRLQRMSNRPSRCDFPQLC
jgi:ArsR family transcriptional regulator, arsenate/arsenite/antimonite-responsive transcriptional repressor